MRSASLLKVLIEGVIAGGAVVFDMGEGHYCLGRVFLDPAYHKQGIGLVVTRSLIEQFPGARRRTLDTPPWNTRTRNFHLKLGFRIVRETEEDLFFERGIS